MSAETAIAPKKNEKIEIDLDALLKKEIKLNDGTSEYIFSRGPKYSEKLWPIQCHLCRVGYMVNIKKFHAHLESEKHLNRLAEGPPDAETFRKPYQQLYSDRMRLMNPIKIRPGEIIEAVTTQYADRLMPCKQYCWDNLPSDGKSDSLKSDIISEYNETGIPILGLCYGFKLFDAENNISYVCALCNVTLGEHNAYQHFVGLNSDHFDQYMNRHFETLLKQINRLMVKNLSSGVKMKWTKNIIRSIYGLLEKWKGYRKMHIIDHKLFESNRHKYVPKARKLLHYSDNIVHFSDAEILELIEKCKRGQFFAVDPERLPKQPISPGVKSKEVKPALEQRKRKNDNGTEVTSQEKTVSKSEKSTNKRPKTAGAPILDDSPENWNKYRDLVERALKSLNDEYGKFIDMSENHPQYSFEWNRYWRRLCVQLEHDNIDPNQYNFMPEWNRFWIRYLEDCYQSDVDKCKFEIRKSLRLPFRARTPNPPGKQHSSLNTNANKNDRNNINSQYNLEISGCDVGFKSGGNSNEGYNNNSSGNNKISENRSSVDNINLNSNNAININENGKNQRQMPLMGIAKITSEPTEETQIELPTEPLSVLSVLRLLTALEDQLGSLGPTATQLLSKAIFYEKETKSSANELLNETEYFTLFAMALEKLKGFVFGGVLVPMKNKAVAKVVTDLGSILSLFEEYKQRLKERNNQNTSKQEIDRDTTKNSTVATNLDKSSDLMERTNSGSNTLAGKSNNNMPAGKFDNTVRGGNSDNMRSAADSGIDMRGQYPNNYQMQSGGGDFKYVSGGNIQRGDCKRIDSGSSYYGGGDNSSNNRDRELWRIGSYGDNYNTRTARNQSQQAINNQNQYSMQSKREDHNSRRRNEKVVGGEIWKSGHPGSIPTQKYNAYSKAQAYDLGHRARRDIGLSGSGNWRSSTQNFSEIWSGKQSGAAASVGVGSNIQMRNYENDYRSGNDYRQREDYQTDKFSLFSSTSNTHNPDGGQRQDNNRDDYSYSQRYSDRFGKSASPKRNYRNDRYNPSIWNSNTNQQQFSYGNAPGQNVQYYNAGTLNSNGNKLMHNQQLSSFGYGSSGNNNNIFDNYGYSSVSAGTGDLHRYFSNNSNNFNNNYSRY